MLKEKDLLKSVIQRLKIYEQCGNVVWWGRLQSLKVRTRMGGWIMGCPKGTPDLLALVRNRLNGITALFLECKSSTGKLTKEQKEFMNLYSMKSDVKVLEIREPKQLDDWIDRYGKDFVDTISR